MNQFLALIAVSASLFFTMARWHDLRSDALTNDDKNTYAFSVAQKAEGHLPTHGLMGTSGMTYGPVAVLLYQGYMAVSPEPLTMRRLQTTLVTLLLILGVALTAYAWRGYVPWFDPLYILLVPIFWAQGRTLWDLTVMIPLSLLAMASYTLFLRDRKMGWLVASAFFSSVMLNSHLMATPWVVAVALHFFLFRRRVIREQPGWFSLALLAFVVPLLPYLIFLVTNPPAQLVRLDAPLFRAVEEKFIGGFKVLSSIWTSRFCDKWEENLGWPARFVVERLGFVVLWFAFGGLYQVYRCTVKKQGDVFLREVSWLSLAVILLSWAQYVIGRLPYHHITYYFYYASWPAYSNVLLLSWHVYAGRRWYLPLKALYWLTLIVALFGLLADPIA